MDIYYLLNSLLWIFVCLIVIFATYMYITWPYSYFKNIGIPGPKPKPVIGTLRDFGKKLMQEIDNENIEQYGKVVGIYEGWTPAYLITDTDILKEVFIKQFDKFCNRRDLPMRGKLAHGIFDVKGSKQWKNQRSQLSRYFTTSKNKMSTKGLNTCLGIFMEMLKKKYDANEVINAKVISNLYTIDAICCTAFGIQVDCINNPKNELNVKLQELLAAATSGNIWLPILVFAPELGKILEKFGIQAFNVGYFEKFISQLIRQREQLKEETADFIDTLTKGRMNAGGNGKGLSDDEIIGNGTLFLLAAYDTTATTLSFLMYNLMTNEDAQQKVYDDIVKLCENETPTYDQIQKMEYLDMCIDETLRLYPVVVRLDRACIEDTVINGVPFKKGSLAVLPTWYMHHNPEIYPEPERFIPERFTRENKIDPINYCPFGVGPRHCIGMRLARLEIKLAITRILQQYKIVMSEKTKVPIELDPNVFTPAAKGGIWFTLEKRV